MTVNIKNKNQFFRDNNSFSVNEKELSDLSKWNLSNDLNLKHVSNKFFSFIAVRSNKNNVLITQNEIGMLAIFAKYDTKDFFEQNYLLQKKFEPGNNPFSQLSPSVQMTYSNIIGTHGGTKNKLDFLDQLSLISVINRNKR